MSLVEKGPSHQPSEREPEWQGPIWKHPYFIYAWLTLALFGFLVVMGALAVNQGWIPQR